MLLLEFFCDSGHVIVFQGSALKAYNQHPEMKVSRRSGASSQV